MKGKCISDVEYNSLYMLYRIPQFLYDVIVRIAQNPDIVKILTIFEKCQNYYNRYNLSR